MVVHWYHNLGSIGSPIRSIANNTLRILFSCLFIFVNFCLGGDNFLWEFMIAIIYFIFTWIFYFDVTTFWSSLSFWIMQGCFLSNLSINFTKDMHKICYQDQPLPI